MKENKMIPQELLGRYELVDPSVNAYKFWHIVFDRSKQEYLITYARIGKRPPYPYYVPEKEAYTKLKSKIKKGYKKVSGDYDEVIGENSIDFIKRICGD
jgi:predicted DNA-binding WGR domain protein